jgi:hypothetical protein
VQVHVQIRLDSARQNLAGHLLRPGRLTDAAEGVG